MSQRMITNQNLMRSLNILEKIALDMPDYATCQKRYVGYRLRRY